MVSMCTQRIEEMSGVRGCDNLKWCEYRCKRFAQWRQAESEGKLICLNSRDQSLPAGAGTCLSMSPLIAYRWYCSHRSTSGSSDSYLPSLVCTGRKSEVFTFQDKPYNAETWLSDVITELASASGYVFTRWSFHFHTDLLNTCIATVNWDSAKSFYSWPVECDNFENMISQDMEKYRLGKFISKISLSLSFTKNDVCQCKWRAI